MRKTFLLLLLVLLSVLFLSFTACAEGESYEIPEDEWESFKNALPDEASRYFSEDALDGQAIFAGELEDFLTPKRMISVIFELFGIEVVSITRLFFLLIAILVISGVLSVLASRCNSSALRSTLKLCSLGSLFCSTGYIFYSHFERLEEFFERIIALGNGMIPITASIWAMGGNVSTASAGSATLYCILNVVQRLWAGSAVPVCALLLVLGFCDVSCTELKTGRVVATVKRVYSFFLGLSMTVLLSSLAAQTTLTAAADGVAARTGRLVSTTVIPIVGGNLGEALRTVASSVRYLKGVFGVGGIVAVALLTLPVVITLLLTRAVFSICSTFADIIGCDEESKLLTSFSNVYGCALAVVAGVGMTFVLALCIFIKTAIAVA